MTTINDDQLDIANIDLASSINGIPIAERRVGRPLHVDDSSEEEISQENYEGPRSDYHGDNIFNVDDANVRDRVANNEVPRDILQRQRGNIPEGAEQLTEQESQREVANCILYSFMDLLAMIAAVVVLFKEESCEKNFKLWYSANGLWAFVSFCFLIWFAKTELKQGYQTKRSVRITYGLEAGYVILSFFAWGILTAQDPNNECANNASSLIELLVDMIILSYMRCLRLVSIIVFIIACGLPILYCYLKNRPKPTEDPAKLQENLNKVTLGVLQQLRNLNYRHKPSNTQQTDAAKTSETDLQIGLLASSNADQTPQPSLEPQSPQQALMKEIDLTCCICMDSFGAQAPSGNDVEALSNPYADAEVVILPCKAHYFHEECISQWITKQNACPVCRVEITLAGLKRQKKELSKLTKEIGKACTASSDDNALLLSNP